MKLLFYHYGLQAGGAERMISLLANYAIQKGDQVTIITKDNQPAFYSLDHRICLIHLNTAHISRNKFEAVKYNLLTIKSLKHALQDQNPDATICFASNTIFHVWIAGRTIQCKLIGSERANPFLRPRSVWSALGPWISTKCDGFLFQTNGARNYYPPKTQAKSIILKNMLDVPAFEQEDISWSLRKNICAVGRMDSGKCFDDLLCAFAIVHQKYPNVCLDMYGDGPERKRLEILAAHLGLISVVSFHGRSQKIISEYAKHKLFVMTSQSEGLPTVLLEAMASGCACVSTNCNFGPADLIQDGYNGFLVPVHDIDAVADRICRLLASPALSSKFSENARKIRETNSVNQISEQFRSYIKQLICR